MFVIGCEDIYEKNSISSQRQARNFMFISMTRSKGWVYLYATGRVKTRFQDELREITKNIPSISFIYPNPDKINEISKINYLIDNPLAKQLDNDISKFKKVLGNANTDTIKALLELDPNFELIAIVN